jgi:hypothetical protein
MSQNVYNEHQLVKQPPFSASLLLMGKVVCFPIKFAGVTVTQSINNKAISRSYGRGRGWAFSPNDFVAAMPRLLLGQVAA